jgi:hypothetical protein
MGLVYMLMFMLMDWEGFWAVFFARLQEALYSKIPISIGHYYFYSTLRQYRSKC